eukprot:CCRYP_021100-RA/>CCRYP_021100-RA protein AED:0.39 eAED:0.45 QI:0/0/0.5/1/0/0/2/1682/332
MKDGDDAEYHESLQETLTNATRTDGDEGKWILFTFALLMSWCFLAIAAAMGYYSWREDRLLRQYQLEGILISGQVSNIVLIRERHDSLRSDVPYSKTATYLVAITYDVELASGYPTGILKWVRLQGDVLPRSLFYRKKSSLIGMTVLFRSKLGLKLSNNENLQPTPTQQEKSSSNADASLPLLMINEFPLSAHPQSAIIKSRSLSSRFVSVFIVSIFAVLGALTHFLAIHIACEEDFSENMGEGFMTFHIFLLATLSLILLFMILIAIAVRFLNNPIGLMLEGEYTKRGEYASKSSGQTNEYTENTFEIACRTMSSRSDVFLSTSEKKYVTL